MQRCKYSRQLSSYYDGELSYAEQAELRRHVQSCASCAKELEQLRKLSRLLKAAHAPSMPEAALSRLHGKIGSVGEVVVVRLAERLIAVAATVLVACGLWLWHADGVRKTQQVPLQGWEIAAMTLEVEDARALSAEELITRWIEMDLSGGNGSD